MNCMVDPPARAPLGRPLVPKGLTVRRRQRGPAFWGDIGAIGA